MISLCCYSGDERLLEKLRAHYGAATVTIGSDLAILESNESAFDVVIIDLTYFELPENGNFSCSVIVLTALPTFQEGFALLQRGVRGYGNIHMRDVNLHQAVDNVSAGQIWLPPDIISRLIDVVGNGEESKKEDKSNLLDVLSKREQEVALLVARGMSNQEVADKMFVSLRTVKAHLSSIYEKTGVRNRLELGLALS